MTLRPLLLLAITLTAAPAPLLAQARGTPVFFDPTYSYDKRVGIDYGHVEGGHAIVGGGSLLFYVGNCKRVALNGAAGVMLPSGGGDSGLNTGVSASYLLNSCPDFTSVSNPTFRLFGGAGLVRVAGQNITDAHVGVGLGHMVLQLKSGEQQIAVGRLELWATPRLHYRELLFDADATGWAGAVSAGFNIGKSGSWGLRAGVDCCDGSIGVGGGFSLWF